MSAATNDIFHTDDLVSTDSQCSHIVFVFKYRNRLQATHKQFDQLALRRAKQMSKFIASILTQRAI